MFCNQSTKNKSFLVATSDPGGTLQLKIRGGGWLDSLGSGILLGEDILGFFNNIIWTIVRGYSYG